MGGQPGRKPQLADDQLLADRRSAPPDTEIETDRLLPVVVGAHPRCELCDRPLASRLVRIIREWQSTELDRDVRPLFPLVCTDVWFLNDRDLMRQPCIAVGDPGGNAATAYLAARLPQAYVVDGVCAVQLDAELLDPSVAVWGTGWQGTEAAVDAFVARYLDRFLRTVHG